MGGGARTADAVVVGGGVVGCAVAYALARAGVSALLLERDDVASHASGAAAGMLTPLGEAARSGAFLRFALESLGLFPGLVPELRERSGIDPEFEACGALHVAQSERAARVLRERAAAFAAHGAAWLDPDAARAAEPRLGPGLRGALWAPDAANVRSALFARALAAAAVQLGARLETGVLVTGLRSDGARVTGVATVSGAWSAPAVVLCAGAWLGACAAWLDAPPRLPVVPVRGQILALDAPRPPLRAMLLGEQVYVVPKRDDSVVLGATEERVGFDRRVTAGGLAQLLAAAPALFPALADCGFRSAWAGLRPATPDGLPLIGPLPGLEGLFVAAGHFRNGVLLAPVTGRLIADALTGKQTPEDASAFRVDRFSQA